MSKGICSILGCNRPRPSSGTRLCAGHYARKKAGNTDTSPIRVWDMQRNPTCRLDDCMQPPVTRGFCQKHYDAHVQKKRTTQWYPKQKAARAAQKAAGLCAVYGCTNLPKTDLVVCAFHQAQVHARYSPQTVHQRKYHEPYENKTKRIQAQGGRCAACHTSRPGKRGWQTDHDHETGEIRGELCVRCNVALGYLDDDPGTVQMLLTYIKSYSKIRG